MFLKKIYQFTKKEIIELGDEVKKDIIFGSGKVLQKGKKTGKKFTKISLGTIAYGIVTLIDGKPSKSFREWLIEVEEKDF